MLQVVAARTVYDFIEIIHFTLSLLTINYQLLTINRLLDVFEEIIHIHQAYAEADSGVFHVHRLAHALGECSEDGACGMDGERTVVEEVGGAMDELQIVQKTEAGFLALQVDADHGSRSFSKLALCQLVIRIILQTNIVYIFYLRQIAQLLGKLQGIADSLASSSHLDFVSGGSRSHCYSDACAVDEQSFRPDTAKLCCHRRKAIHQSRSDKRAGG